MPKEPLKPNDDKEREALDRELDEELDDTFPASDPPKVTRVPRRSQIISDDDREQRDTPDPDDRSSISDSRRSLPASGRLESGFSLRAATFSALSLLAVLVAAPVQATEGGASLYVPGLRGPLAGVTPPPGFYFNNDAYYYYGELGGGRRTQIGGAVLANIKQRAYVDFVTPIWVTPLQLLGGNLAFSVTLPFGAPYVTAGALIEAPRLGRTFVFKQRDQDFNFGDPVVASFIGWNSGKFHWQTGISVSIPAGGYEDGELSNVAFNRPIGDIYGALTYLDPELGLDISGVAGFEINGENDDTEYRSGNAVHFDLAISKFLTKELSVGVLAGHYQQVTGDSGEGNRIGPFKGRTTAVGGTIAYNFTVGQIPVSTRIKVLREVETENRFRGTIGLFTVSFPLGGQTPPAAQQPIRARY